MLLIVALAAAALFVFACRGVIKQYAAIFYSTAALLSAAAALVDLHFCPAWMQTYFFGLLTRGAFATALWCIVMWTGALPNGSKAMKMLMPIRGELSILAAIFTLGHNIGYGRIYFVRMFTDAAHMSGTQFAAGVLSLLMLLIMLPLTILSFPSVRKKVAPKVWKQIQRFAYLFYAMLYAHIMLLFLPMAMQGRWGYRFSIIVYSIIFLGYAVFRIRKALLRNRTIQRVIVVKLCFLAAALLLGIWIAMMFAVPSSTGAPELSEPAESSTDTEKTEKLEVSVQPDETFETLERGTMPMYMDGIYTASAYGYDGDITITIIIENNRIVSVSGSSTEEDPWYFSQAQSMFSAIQTAQSPDVDIIAGATYSSKAIIAAAKQALMQAEN